MKNDFSDDYWSDFDPDAGSFTEIIPTIENLNKVSTDTSGVILYTSLDGNKNYFAAGGGGDIKAIIESSRLGRNLFKINDLVIQAIPVKIKTVKTIFSS